MIAYRQLAPTNICRSAVVISSLAWLGAGLAASTANAAYDDGWQASAGNSSREAPADWAPNRNQLREAAAASAANQDASQANAPASANSNTAKTSKQQSRPNDSASAAPQEAAAKNKVTAADPQTATTAPRWMLPNQQASATTKTAASNSTGQAPHEPRPFVPASNNARQLSTNQPTPPAASSQRMPAGATAQPTQHTHSGPAPAHQVTTTNPNAQTAQQRYAARSNPPSPVGYPGGSMPASRNVNAYAQQPNQQPKPRSNTYSGRVWNAVNVAFQSPGEWGEGVEPEQIPMPTGGYSMGGEYAPHMMAGSSCCDGACGCGDGGCGDGCGCGCGDSCGDSCGSGICGCEGGCGCGGVCEPGCGCEPSCGCGQCNKRCCMDDVCIGVGDDQSCHTIRLRLPKWQELSIFGGVHGFKGPYDQVRDSGNFGFQEGLNLGFKVPFSGLGYQVGYQAVQSELNGDENTGIRDSFTQHFLTAGVFHRTKNGVQGGVAWDMLSDDRFGTHNFYQLRAEMSLINGGCHELGASITAHLNDHEFVQDEAPSIYYRATDQYLFFYRFHSPKGGEGRFYGGFTDDSDAIVGSDMLIPLSDRWSLATAFTYLIPDAPSGTEGSAQEAWNISTALVWSWDCRARRSHSNCYRPLFNVADNGILIVNDHPGQALQVSDSAAAPLSVSLPGDGVFGPDAIDRSGR